MKVKWKLVKQRENELWLEHEEDKKTAVRIIKGIVPEHTLIMFYKRRDGELKFEEGFTLETLKDLLETVYKTFKG